MNNLQSERENIAQKFFSLDQSRFYPLDEIEYKPENPKNDLVSFLAKTCEAPSIAVSLHSIQEETATLYDKYKLAGYITMLRHLSPVIRNRLMLREPYGFVFSHLLLYSQISNKREDADVDAVFVCARHLRENYTAFIQNLLLFDTFRGILGPKFRNLLAFYLTTLKETYGGTLPLW